MKKILLLTALILLFLPVVLAINVEITKQSSNEVLITDLKTSAVFDLKFENLGSSDTFKLYNLVGMSMSPKNIYLDNKEIKEIKLTFTPIEELKIKGLYNFKFTIRGSDESEIEKSLTLNVIELKDAFEIGSKDFNSDSSTLKVYIKNKYNVNFDNINAKFKSSFFNFEEEFSLESNERKSFEIRVDKEDFKKLMAGFYTLTAEINVEKKKADIEGTIKFVEKGDLKTESKDYGIIINTKIIKKINQGNIVSGSQTIIKKNIISRLFTSFSPEPDISERQGFLVYYTWNKNINPGETLEIVVKTNWLFPFILILLIIVTVVLAKQYTKTNLSLKKKVAFVHAKGGEFALKVSILIHSRKYVEKVSIIDKLPALVKIYERFGGEKPIRIDEKNKRMEWSFEKLEEGETRILSYIIYSKIGVLGKFALPTATAIYEKEGKIQETESNRAFFIAEQRKKDIED